MKEIKKQMCSQYCNFMLKKTLLHGLFFIVTNKKTYLVLSIFLIVYLVQNKINAKQHKKVRSHQLKSILDEISKLSNENFELEKSLSSINWNLPKSTRSTTQYIPNIEYENLRRQVANNVKEMWYFIKNQIKACYQQINKNQIEAKKSLDRILSIGIQHKRHLRNSLTNLSMVDGYSTWRIEESKNLTNLIQARLRYLQNPKDCKKARKILCQFDDFKCGFGCSFHNVISFVLIAYDLKRTLVSNTENWIYGSDGWKSFFEPISESCVSWENKTVVNWPGNKSAHVIKVPLIRYLKPYPSYLPMAVPSDIQPRLERLHRNPNAWWIGQIATYLFKLNNITNVFINNLKKQMGFKKPIVGVHIRRTDKIREAKFYNLTEYMDEVDEYYNEVVGNTTERRRMYLATEEQTVIDEAKKNYSHYEVLTNDQNFIKENRYNKNSLKGLLIDIYLLSNADFLVCTFTSNVCRLAYELMQYKFPDASDRFKSLDFIYHYGGSNEPFTHIATGSYRSIHSTHTVNSKDKILKRLNYWNGYSLGVNVRTNKTGKFPSFKARIFSRSHNYSNYDDVN